MNRSKFKGTKPHHPWLITFADMLLIVLVLFVLLYSYSETDMKKFETVMDSIQSHHLLDHGSGLVDFDGAAPGDGDQEAPDGTDDSEEDGTAVPEEYEDRLADMIAREENIQEILDYVEAYANEHDLEEKMTVSPTARGIEVVLPEVMLFPSGQARLLDEAIRFLDDMAPLLADIKNPIEVEGHTDDRPISTARFPSNWDLSTARSNTVIRYLVEEHGLDPKRFKAIGYGEYHPIASNDTEEGKSRNRRVVMIITDEEHDS